MLTHVRFSVIPPEVLMDRRRRLRQGMKLPKGKVEMPERGTWRTWPGLIASMVLHLTFAAAATGLLTWNGTCSNPPQRR